MISKRLYKTIGHGRTLVSVPEETNIKLPVRENGGLDFDFMSNFIKGLDFAEFL